MPSLYHHHKAVFCHMFRNILKWFLTNFTILPKLMGKTWTSQGPSSPSHVCPFICKRKEKTLISNRSFLWVNRRKNPQDIVSDP